MSSEIELKAKLQTLAENDFRLSETDQLTALIPAMLNHIGAADSDLRDDLIYMAFASWIVEYKIVNQDQLRDLWRQILSDRHLFYRIGERDTDSVFRRSFSVLLLPLLLIAHRQRPFLTPSQLNQTKNALLHYLTQEKDRRGFVEGNGWAHPIAHAADALDDLAQCPELNAANLQELLDAVRAAVAEQEIGYLYGEEERLITAVIAILNRNLIAHAELEQWIQGFADAVTAVEAMPQKMIIRANVKSFLQALHFRLQWEQIDSYAASINQTLHRLSWYANAPAE